MSAEELREDLKQQPFRPFRVVMSDGGGFDIVHPDLLWVGQRSAMIGLTGAPSVGLYERTVRVDLRHVVRTEPLPMTSQAGSNGEASGG